MKKALYITTLAALLFFTGEIRAQQKAEVSLSLKQCLAAGLQSSREIKDRRLEIEKSDYKKQEALSQFLPHAEAFGTYDNYLKIPVQMVPGDIFGQPGTSVPISLFVQHNVSGGIKATQVLYNQTAFTLLSLSEKAKEISEISLQKAGEDLIYDITSLYFLIKVTEAQEEILKGNIERLNRLLKVTESQYSAGLVRGVDIERIKINRENLVSELSSLEILNSRQAEMLKYTIGGMSNANIILTDSLQESLFNGSSPAGEPSDINNRYELQLISKQMDVALLNKKMASSGYYPSLTLYGQYYYQGQRERFDFLKGGSSMWSDVGIVGLSLSIPVFDGLQKSSQIKEAEVEYMQAENSAEFTKRYFSIEYSDAVKKYNNSKDTERRQKENVLLAEKVYEQTLLQYQQGVAMLSDLLEVENSMSGARMSLLNAVHQSRMAELDILKASGNLKSILNQ